MKLKLITTLALAVAGWNAQDAAAAIYASTTSSAIADYPGTGTASAITVTDAGTVSAVNSVTFSIAGGWAGDYSVVLQYTDGSATLSSTLFSALQGGAAANVGFDNVVLTTATGSAISGAGSTSSSAALTGTYSGVNYSAFNGVSAAGDWILFVKDNQSGEVGTLTGWSLNLNVSTVPEPANAALAVFGVVLVTSVGVRRWRRTQETILE